MKGTYWTGRKPTTMIKVVLTPDDLRLRGCLRMEERRTLLEQYQNGDLTREKYGAELKEAVNQNSLGRDDVSPTLLKLTVPHGGYVIMYGKNMQRCYEVRTGKPG
jgi:hypothetical protein